MEGNEMSVLAAALEEAFNAPAEPAQGEPEFLWDLPEAGGAVEQPQEEPGDGVQGEPEAPVDAEAAEDAPPTEPEAAAEPEQEPPADEGAPEEEPMSDPGEPQGMPQEPEGEPPQPEEPAAEPEPEPVLAPDPMESLRAEVESLKAILIEMGHVVNEGAPIDQSLVNPPQEEAPVFPEITEDSWDI